MFEFRYKSKCVFMCIYFIIFMASKGIINFNYLAQPFKLTICPNVGNFHVKDQGHKADVNLEVTSPCGIGKDYMDMGAKRNKHVVGGDKLSQRKVIKKLNMLDKFQPKVEDEKENSEDDDALLHSNQDDESCQQVNKNMC